MAEPVAGYRVIYSERVRQRIGELADLAALGGDGEAFAAAVREIHHRLTVYPQFGDPIIDLSQGGGQVRTGVIRPLALRYGVNEEQRLVLVVALPVLLPMAEPEAD